MEDSIEKQENSEGTVDGIVSILHRATIQQKQFLPLSVQSQTSCDLSIQQLRLGSCNSCPPKQNGPYSVKL
jgi:hypothetical protein